MRIVSSLFSGRYFFGFDCGFSFSRRDDVLGCFSLRYRDVGWTWALSLVDVCVLFFDVSDPRLYVGCVVFVGAFG